MAAANVANTLVVPSTTKVSPYYDDFDESKNFHRILFRPGYAVQSRELTQLQTILQNQVERFGRHLFVNGSSVIGGKIDITDSITLNLSPTFANTDIDVNVFKDKTITLNGSTGNDYVSARVVQVSESSNTAPPSLIIKYVSGAEFSPGNTIKIEDAEVYANIAPLSNAICQSSLAFIYDSIYFMDGYFIKVPQQVIALSKYDRQANARVGLELVDNIITEATDSTLLDPALEASNYQAPGASRYQVELVLNKRTLDSIDDEKFIQIALIENGIIKELIKNPIYSEIEEVLARRTYDQSGNYTVRPFNLTIENSKIDPANNYTLVVSPGKAYLYGYEIENQTESKFEIPAARDIRTVSNYGLKMNYGNYVIVDKLKGYFNTTSLAPIDMHCVTANLINYSNTSTYLSTKIGTARVRDLNFYGGSSNVDDRQFELYFLDNKFRVINGNVASLTANSYNININTANVSSANDAYVGAFIKISSGNAAGDLRLITGFDGVNKVATVSPRFSASPESNTPFEIRFDMTDVDSFVANAMYTPSVSSEAAASISYVSKDNELMTGNTVVSDSILTRSLFEFPESYIAPGGISNQSYIYRKIYNSIQFTSGVSTPLNAGTDEEFMGSTTTSNTDLDVMSNYLVVVSNKTGSDRDVGDQVKVISTVTTSLPQQTTLNTGNTSESFVATVYSKMRVFGTSATPRVKVMVLANSTNFSASSPDAQFTNPTGSNTKVYLNSGQVLIKNFSANSEESLYISDIIGTKAIYGTDTEPTAGQNLETLENVAGNFILNNGQRDEYYDHGTLKLKPGYVNRYKYLIVCLRYYRPSSDSGYYSVDSYPYLANTVYDNGIAYGTGYSIIPSAGDTRIADTIDFRPVRPNASNNSNFLFTSVRTPISGTEFITDFDHYLERRDILTLSVNDQINYIQGHSSYNPVFPSTPYRNLVLHRLRVLPYTLANSSILVKSFDYRRYTMEDINQIDKRLERVEYSVQLNSLEKSADDIVIKDVNGISRTKYGIFAENFTSEILVDKTNGDHSCAIDALGNFAPRAGTLMPQSFVGQVKLESNTSIGVARHNDKFLISYSTKPAITQNVASKALPVSDYLFGEYRGQILTYPEADIWKYTPPPPPPPPVPVTPLPPPRDNGDGTVTYDDGGGQPVTISKTEYYNVSALYAAGAANGGLGGIKYDRTTNQWISDYGASGTGLTNIPTAAMSTADYNNVIKNGAVNSGYITSPEKALNVTDTAVNFITSIYQTQLGRPVDVAGIQYWTAIAAEHSLSRSELALLMAPAIAKEQAKTVTYNANPSYYTSSVPGLFGAGTTGTIASTGVSYTGQTGTGAVGIQPTPADRTGLSPAGVPSISRDVGSAPVGSVAAAYANALGRPPDAGGAAYWQAQMNAGMSYDTVVAFMKASPEGSKKAY